MRVLRLALGDGDVVDLHPTTSVVTGLSERQRCSLRSAFDAIGTGLQPEVDGLIECHGLLLDATQADLDLLDVASAPATTVAAIAAIPGAVPADEDERLRTAERDLLLLAGDHRAACLALADAESAADRPTRFALLSRAAALRERAARHAARDPEPVRVALDAARDGNRAGATPVPSQLDAALATVGLDVAGLGLPAEESVRIAEDWLAERHHESVWLVGAGVELAGIERALAAPAHERPPTVDVDVEPLRQRARRAAEAHAEALRRADELRTELAARHGPTPSAREIERHLTARLETHRPARLAGSAPLVIDGVLGHLPDADVVSLLDRVTAAAAGIQLVVVDDHLASRRWAEAAGARRAAVVSPSPASRAEVVA